MCLKAGSVLWSNFLSAATILIFSYSAQDELPQKVYCHAHSNPLCTGGCHVSIAVDCLFLPFATILMHVSVVSSYKHVIEGESTKCDY